MKKQITLALVFLLIIVGSLCLSGCNGVTRSLGGTQTITLEENQKLVNVTWKDKSLWILTRPAKAGEKPETYDFKEESNLGVLEGEVKLVEH
ncbi:hypothetical protein IAQ67_28890 (plasmid) [Paenibacillus peoriae]|uniref:Uncharacterized protein n=1 Tax=Paenibacillus peoriae TaxID=59893 RepID=A0A7H0YH17_9BACL|nr:hypothetical protein [Paenibacillus peoriae]QNR70375.1 hypothetical protein IAQ67_28890 [Paenibacillus peoriae]